ncbi:MAG: helix-turn-helix domain-containing protein [Clostridiales bacterium]|nr:helix-turn-helix domain-containing protein [Clostridiales bacterium]
MDNQLYIGKNIRAVRLGLGMTQQELADQCDLSKGMISKVENGVVVPALATLTKIAQSLCVKVSDLIEMENQQPSIWAMNPFSNPEKFINTSMGYQMFSPSAGLKDKKMQPILITATQKKVKPHLVTHPGEEYIFIFDGEMTFKVGEITYLMRKGDSLFFDATQEHGIRSVNGFVQYLDVFCGHHFAAH